MIHTHPGRRISGRATWEQRIKAYCGGTGMRVICLVEIHDGEEPEISVRQQIVLRFRRKRERRGPIADGPIVANKLG